MKMNLKSIVRLMVANTLCWVATAVASQPNIIFVLCDDLGYGDLGVLFQNDRVPGLPKHATPQLDQMAAGGVQLRNHYCPAPVCAPSRASLLNGVHQGHSTVRDNQFEKALDDNHTLGTVLKEAGYATAAFGKWGLKGSVLTTAPDWEAHPLKRGFDYYYGYMTHGDGHQHYPKEDGKKVYENYTNVTDDLDLCYTTDLFTARAKKWMVDHLASPDASKPMFLYLAYDTPHAILQYPPSAYPAGGGLSNGVQWVGTPGAMINTATGTKDAYVHPDYASATYDDDNNAGTPEVVWPEVYKRYAGSVRRIDDCVGDILQLLEDLNIATNTMVVFTSDNGPSKEDYLSLTPNYAADFFDNYGPFDGIKRDVWEGGIRVATLAHWPGAIPTNSISHEPSAFWDWMPTFAEMAGVSPPAKSDGVSLLPTLTGQGVQRSGNIYIEYFQSGNTPSYSDFDSAHQGRVRNQMQAIHLDGYKGVRYDIGSHADNFEIYDVIDDPQESTNLALNAAFDDLQQRMKDRVLQVRRPNTSALRPYDNELVPAVALQSAYTNGLVKYEAFEGEWPWIPDFQSLSNVATGFVAGIDLSIRSRPNNYGILFSGYIEIETAGDYTFYLTSDAGCSLRIHEALVIDDDFNHDGSEVSGSIFLDTGRHPFRLAYRHATGGETLTFEYAGPGLAKQPIPVGSFNLPVPGMVAVDDTVSTPGGMAVLIDVLANDAPSGVSIAGVSAPESGSVTITNGRVLYIPAVGFLGKDTFTYTATEGGETNSASVAVDVHYSDGLIWFPFNQTSGFETLSASGAHTAVLRNYAASTNHWVAGPHNRALSFDGVAQSATIFGFNGILGTSPRTIMAWVRTTSTSQRAIAGWGSKTVDGGKWSFTINGSGKIRQEVDSGSVIGTATVNDGSWHHVALSFPGGNITGSQLYVDGVSDPISSSSGRAVDTLNTGPVMIGLDNQNRYFDGEIDELRIYDYAMTPAEIQTIYNGTDQASEAWIRRYLGNATVDWESDGDSDAAKLLVEYALGGQPAIPEDTSLWFQSDIQTDRLHIYYPRRMPGTHDLTYTVQISSDLTEPWNTLTPGQVSTTLIADHPDFEEVKIELDQPFGSEAQFFIRLRISI